jgi:hypothetical protein
MTFFENQEVSSIPITPYVKLRLFKKQTPILLFKKIFFFKLTPLHLHRENTKEEGNRVASWPMCIE